MKPFTLLCVLVLGCFTTTVLCARESKPVRVLLFSGSNNHDWKTTTPYIEQLFARDNNFTVVTTCAPDTLTEAALKQFDVIVSNRNAFPENSENWTSQAKDAFMRFMELGGGFVAIHAASATHYDWPAFLAVVGATWGEKTHHGPIENFKVIVKNTKHPITKGIQNFNITDELWIDLKRGSAVDTLCYAVSDVNGVKKREAVALTTQIGNGHGFYLVLGHDTAAMASKEWQQLLLQGTKWAARSK